MRRGQFDWWLMIFEVLLKQWEVRTSNFSKSSVIEKNTHLQMEGETLSNGKMAEVSYLSSLWDEVIFQ